MKQKISVIIPTFREEKNIVHTIQDIITKGCGDFEIIVIDGSSDDLTQYEIDRFPQVIYQKLVHSFRANSMNKGASLATGDMLLFLHADTILPESIISDVSGLCFEKNNYGCFLKKFTPNSVLLQGISSINNFQTHIFGSMLGDNGIFVSKELFAKVGGFPEIQLMEDIEFSKKLKKIGKMKIIKNKVQTSSRKFQKKGVLKTLFFMQYIRFLYFIGTDTELLEKRYRSF